MRESRKRATSELNDSIDDALGSAESALQKESAERTAFLDHGCTEFKASTSNVLREGQLVVTAALNLSGVNKDLFDTQAARERVEEASCKRLYPVYRAGGLEIQAAQNDMADKARITRNRLNRLRNIIRERTAPLVCQSDDPAICAIVENSGCGVYIRNATEIENILSDANKAVTAFEVAGTAATAVGKIGVWEAEVGAWGFAGAHVNINVPEYLAYNLKSVSAAIQPVTEKHQAKLESCVDLYMHDQMVGKVNELLAANGSL